MIVRKSRLQRSWSQGLARQIMLVKNFDLPAAGINLFACPCASSQADKASAIFNHRSIGSIRLMGDPFDRTANGLMVLRNALQWFNDQVLQAQRFRVVLF